MQTKQIYYEDQYKTSLTAKIADIETNVSTAIVSLDKTIFYPEGGGQPSDQGTIVGKEGSLDVQQVLVKNGEIVHIGKLTGKIKKGETVDLTLDWNRRLKNMQVHTLGHIIHDSIMQIFPDLTPINADHGKNPFIKYKGHLTQVSANLILEKVNEIIKDNFKITTEFVTLDELLKRAPWVPENLPKNKPLRIMQIGNFSPIPDGGTQLKKTGEIPGISNIKIVSEADTSIVYYTLLNPAKRGDAVKSYNTYVPLPVNSDSNEIINVKNQAIAQIAEAKDERELEQIRIDLFGKNGKFTSLLKSIKDISQESRGQFGSTLNEAKNTIEQMLVQQKSSFKENAREWFDPTIPAKKINVGKTHFVTQAIDEIASVFEKIGFTRSRYPEVEWDYYAFEALNFPENHPARDDWETFFVDTKKSEKYGPMLLTPHTSSGQIREMENNKPPIRMINIAKCYRRQTDAKHLIMFHQFEGLVVDKNISITHLRGTIDYFGKTYFGPDRTTRIRPYHFQFTEPSFEVDISCNVCNGKGCKLCKEGWVEIGGAGMVHPNVLNNCGVDSKVYSGFAFGWGVERVSMMKSGLSVPDIRLLYSTDLRVLSQL
jgi:phenylalanyl-tRNA synthetase alpha chain